jgi:monothiol glutaredoxin
MDAALAERIRSEIERNDVLLYMKGTPVFPQCSCSAQAVQILNMLGVKYESVDVLSNPSVRQGIKDYTRWPTIPQLFVKGQFVGDNDIMREMAEAGELQALFAEKGLSVEV